MDPAGESTDQPETIPLSVLGRVTETPEAQRRFTARYVVTITCPYCGDPHTHAAPLGPLVDPGFRLAHCRLDRRGYLIVVSHSTDP